MREETTNNQLFLQDQYKLSLSMIYNEDTLNIFSDASFKPFPELVSYRGREKYGKGCYCVMAVNGDDILEKECRICSNSTVHSSELKGIRKALSIANGYKHQYRRINIFSDSLTSIQLIRKRVIEGKESIDLPHKDRSAVIQIYYLYMELALDPHCIVTLYHNSGHMETQNLESMIIMAQKFKKFNNLKDKVDLNLVRYIARYNCLVDTISRDYLLHNKEKECEDPLEFITSTDAEMKANKVVLPKPRGRRPKTNVHE